MEIQKGVELLNSDDSISGIKDDDFFYTKDELQAIRLHRTMYISADGTDGAIHLFKEILANSIDECNNNNPHWKDLNKEITVIFNQSKREIIVIDNGRGIPVDILTKVVMQKHASTKTVGISNIRNKKVTGLNGVGLTVCAALCDKMSITSYRGDHSKTIDIIDGELIEYPIKDVHDNKFGTEVKLIPSEKILGPIELTNDIIEDYIRNISYILEPDITIYLKTEKEITNKGKIKYCTKEYKHKGLSSCVEYMSSSLEFKPIETKFCSDEFDISIAFSYDKTLDESLVTSFGNYVITTEGGCHEVAAIQTICNYFTKEGKRQDPSNKNEIIFDDCKKGLVLAVNLEHIAPKFAGQHKTKVGNNEIIPIAKKGLYDNIYKIMNLNPNIQKKIISYLRQVSKIRQERHRIKGISTKKKSSFLEDSLIENYFTVSNRNSQGYKELFLAEGDSACGGILNSRNAAYQAVYTVSGVTDNVYSLSLAQLLKKKTFVELINILGTGIGTEFDITKLRYNKIIICTDADIDGMNICSLILCFFYIFMRPLIEGGYIYRASPPLYLMDVKSLRRFYNGREWLYDKNEYYNMLNTIIANNVDLALELNEGTSKDKRPKVQLLTKKETMEWLRMNSEYKIELDNLGKKAASDPRILESVCFLKLKGYTDGKLKRELEKLYPEMNYDLSTCAFIGAHEGKFYSLICDTLFDKSAKRFINELSKNDYLYVWYKNKKDKNDNLKRVTIGEFLDTVYDTFNVKIDQRFKGVGESEAELLFKTVTNPKFRKLIRVDIKDIEKTDKIFELLHGKSEELRQARRDLIDSMKLSYADIDN